MNIWNSSVNPEPGFALLIEPKTEEDLETFAAHSGHHFISSFVEQNVLNSKNPRHIEIGTLEYNLLWKTSPAMKVFLNNPEMKMCTAFLVLEEAQEVSQKAQVSYLSTLFQQ